MPSSPHEVAAVGALMAEQSAEPIPPDFAEAFAYAVLVYEIWTPEEPGRSIQIGPRYCSIIEVCGFVDVGRIGGRCYVKALRNGVARCHAGHREGASPLLPNVGGSSAAYFDASRPDRAKAGASATTARPQQDGIGRLSWRPRRL